MEAQAESNALFVDRLERHLACFSRHAVRRTGDLSTGTLYLLFEIFSPLFFLVHCCLSVRPSIRSFHSTFTASTASASLSPLASYSAVQYIQCSRAVQRQCRREAISVPSWVHVARCGCFGCADHFSASWSCCVRCKGDGDPRRRRLRRRYKPVGQTGLGSRSGRLDATAHVSSVPFAAPSLGPSSRWWTRRHSRSQPALTSVHLWVAGSDVAVADGKSWSSYRSRCNCVGSL